MYYGTYVFSQIMEFINEYEFKKCIIKYNGEHGVRKLSCRDQFRAMIFGQLSYRDSLRDIVTCLQAHTEKLYHLGIQRPIALNTLAMANKRRDWRIYRDLAMILISKVRLIQDTLKELHNLDLDATVYLIDSTVIDLCLNLFRWAKFDKVHASVKLNMQLDLKGSIPAFFTITEGKVNDVNFLDDVSYEPGAYYVMDKGYLDYARWNTINESGAFFVTRARANMLHRRLYSNVVDKSSGVICDQTITLTAIRSKERYPNKIRRVKYRDKETQIVYTFLTNDFNSNAFIIATLYKHRWHIELFFKWIKQHLKIQSFWGTSSNAVKTQICIALCAYLIMALIKKRLDLKMDLYRILQITSLSLLDKKPLKQLFSQDRLPIDSDDVPKRLNLWGE